LKHLGLKNPQKSQTEKTERKKKRDFFKKDKILTRILLSERTVESSELLTIDPLGLVRVRVLEIKIVLVILEEFRGSDIHTNLDLTSVTSLLNGFNKEIKTFLILLDVGSETTFITNVGSIETILGLDDTLEVVVDFGTDLHGFLEGLGTSGKNHEFLHGELVTSMRTTVDDIEGRDGEDKRLLGTGKVGKVDVERDTLLTSSGLGNGEGNTKDGVGTELTLVGGTIKLDEEVINGLLFSDIDLGVDQSGSNDSVDVVNGLEDT
jgi:hypothetical protein